MSRVLYSYKYFDFTLASEVPLVELPGTDARAPHFEIRLMGGYPAPLERQEWDWEWSLPSGETFLSVAKVEKGRRLRFPGILDILWVERQRSVELSPVVGIPGEIVRHLILDHVLPRLVSHQGRLVLHAAAVANGEYVLLLVGRTGAGKSTLGASYIDAGFELLTDDCVLLEAASGGFNAIPAYPGLRLWPDSVTGLRQASGEDTGTVDHSWKTRLSIETTSSDWQRVTGVVVLEEPRQSLDREDITVTPVRGSAAVVELLQHGFLLDPGDRQVIERQFLAVGDLAESLPLFRVTFPHDFSRLIEVRAAIAESLGI